MKPGSPWYRLLDHTGDVALLVRAPTLEGIYDGAARALFEVIVDVRTVGATDSVPVEVERAVDAEALLVRFLSELLFLHDARGWLFRGFDARSLSAEAVRGEASGERFDPHRHRILRQVKAVTYHHLLLSRDADGWSARLVLDL